MASANVLSVLGEDVAQLYAAYGKLSTASSNPALLAAETATYAQILSAVKGSDAAKQLAADYIPAFLHLFPASSEEGINAQLDLIEDENRTIRIHAIRGLETICKNNPATVKRIADVLAQLLPSTDQLELNATKTTFSALFNLSAADAFQALFTQATSQDAALRKAVLEFLQPQLKNSAASLKKNEAASAALCTGLKAILTSTASGLIGPAELRFFVQTLIALCPYGNAPAKIRADATLVAELGAIAVAQAGLKNNGLLDQSSEAALRHFLAVQGTIANLIKEYGIDAAPFSAVLFQQLLPNLEAIADVELRTQVLHAICNGASKLTPKTAQQFFAVFFALFKQNLPTGVVVPKPEAAGAAAAAAAAPAAAVTPAAAAASSSAAAKINYSSAESFLYLFHIFAPLAPEGLKVATGLFTPTGQPGEDVHAKSEKRDEFTNRLEFLLQSNAAYKESLNQVAKSINEQAKEQSKKVAAAKAAAKPAAAAAAAAPAAGQPKAAAAAVEVAPAALAGPTVEEESAALTTLRSKLNSVQGALRIANNIVALTKPLLTKPLPTYQAAASMNLSWRSRAPGPEGKQQQQSGQQAKQAGGKQQQGQKRKSGGGDQHQQQQTKSASNKKRSQSGSSHQGGNQQQSQKSRKTGQQQSASSNGQQRGGGQSGSNKKQKTQNGGGNSGSQKKQQRQRR